MGKEIEKIALLRNHEIVAIIDNTSEIDSLKTEISKADVIIDFSFPETAYDNILKYLDFSIPLVIGTTGWYEHLASVKEMCIQKNKSVFVASNFSIGMNIAFELNKKMAQIFEKQNEYQLKIEETHHLQKKDSPSGTAITLANDIIEISSKKSDWINEPCGDAEKIEIISQRIDNVFGIHSVIYNSEFDQIELKHTAHNRKGFAYGAVLAAEWLIGKTGFYTMNNMLNL